ncbi:MAG: hypothetical protein QM767_01870 [Anaeromyxobacter sp.]
MHEIEIITTKLLTVSYRDNAAVECAILDAQGHSRVASPVGSFRSPS